jgi:hypothetical protein
LGVKGVYNEPPTVSGLNSRGSTIQTAEGQRFQPSRVSGSNRSRSAAPNTESTSETTDIENPPEINNRDLSEGTDSPPANLSTSTEENKEAYNPTTQDDDVVPTTSGNQEQNHINDEEHGPALADVVATIEALGAGSRLLEHARRAGAIGPDEGRVGESDARAVGPGEAAPLRDDGGRRD